MSTFTSTDTGVDDAPQGRRRDGRRLERWMETTRKLVTAATLRATGVREIDAAPRRPPVFEPLPVQELPRLRFVGEPSMTAFASPQAGGVARDAGSAPVSPG
jgi:hypothetical protein